MTAATLERTADHGFTLSRIKEGDMAHAMITLSRQYSRPMDAVIRELATNALESHQAAGYTGPVEITLPSSADPFVTIADRGLGLGLEDITDVIGDYADSTKRHDGQVTPNYGIGSKSPYAVSDSYTIVAVKDGVRREVLFARLTGGNPGYKILSTAPTSEANGVSVRVPVPDVLAFDSWREAATNVLYWWEKGTFLVHRANFFTGDPETLEIATFRDEVRDRISTPSVLSIKTGFAYSDGSNVMVRTGTAGYSVPYGFFDDLGLSLYGLGKLCVEMPKDSIKVSPNRESIEDTDGNRELIYAALSEWAETISSTYLTKLGAATSSYNLYRAWMEVTQTERVLTGTTSLTATGDKFGKTISIELPHLKYPERGARRQEHYLAVTKLNTAPCLALEELDNRAAGIIAKWRSAHGKPAIYVFTDKEDVRPLIDPDQLDWVSLADLKAETPTRRAAPTPVSLSDTDTVDRIWYHLGRSRGMAKSAATIGDLKKLIADGRPLIIGTVKDYADLAADGGETIDYDNVAAVTCPTKGLSNLVENTLGQKASTPSGYRYSLYLKQIEDLDDEQKQAFVERATLPRPAIRNAAHLNELCSGWDADHQPIPRYTADVLEALAPLTALRGDIDPVYAQLPGMPEPRLGIELKHTVALLNELYAPSELLLKMALRADKMAAGDRRRRSQGKSTSTK